MKKKRLGEILTERGKISAADLTNALQQQKEKSLHLGELLLQTGLISREDLLSTLAEVFHVEYVDCTRLQPAPDVLMLIPGELAKKFHAVPAARDGKTLTVVMAEPQNFRFIEELQFKTGLKIEPRLGLQGEIVASIDRLYAHLGGSDGAQLADSALGMEFISASSQERNIQAMQEMQAELQQESKTTPAVQLVASIISAAVAKAASDIHIEPQQEETQVRFRVDGMMRDYQRIPRALQHTVASRIKILSDMD